MDDAFCMSFTYNLISPSDSVVYENVQQTRGHKEVEQQQFIPCEDSAGYGCAGFCEYGVRCRPGPNGCTCGSKFYAYYHIYCMDG